MKTIHKHRLELGDVVDVATHAGARPVHVAVQYDNVCVWVEVDTDQPIVARRFEVIGTGHAAPERGQHVGSFLVEGGAFVFHVYDLGEAQVPKSDRP